MKANGQHEKRSRFPFANASPNFDVNRDEDLGDEKVGPAIVDAREERWD